MNRLSTLGALIGGAIIVSVLYGIAFGDRNVTTSFDVEEGDGIRHIVNGDRGDFSLRRDDLIIKASWRGDYTLNEDGDDIASLEHKLEISRDDGELSERVIFARDGDKVERTYYRDDEKQDNSDETQAAIGNLLSAFLGASGIKAEERVAILLRKGGVNAVLDEMNGTFGDHARRSYTVALTEQVDLSPPEIRALLTALDRVESDHDLRLALSAILENESVSADEMPAFLATAAHIESDYDLRRLIETVADEPMNDASLALAIGLLETIESDHDLRRAGEALLAQDNLSAENAARLLTAAANQLESDHDIRLLLTDSVKFLAQGDIVAKAWLEAFDAISGDHDQRLTLSAAAEVSELSPSVVTSLIDATTSIESDHDQRLALETFADRAADDPVLLTAYKSAADRVGSDQDRRRALEAIGEASD